MRVCTIRSIVGLFHETELFNHVFEQFTEGVVEGLKAKRDAFIARWLPRSVSSAAAIASELGSATYHPPTHPRRQFAFAFKVCRVPKLFGN
jgi:hypothetical protein